MSAREIIISKLLSVSAITALVGEKIYPSAAPQNTPFPYIIVHKPGQENRQLLTGSAKYPRSRVSLECVAGNGAAADAIGQALYAALENVINEEILEGESPTIVKFTVNIMPADSDIDDSSDDRSSFRRIIDFYVDWR